MNWPYENGVPWGNYSFFLGSILSGKIENLNGCTRKDALETKLRFFEGPLPFGRSPLEWIKVNGCPKKFKVLFYFTSSQRQIFYVRKFKQDS